MPRCHLSGQQPLSPDQVISVVIPSVVTSKPANGVLSRDFSCFTLPGPIQASRI